MQGFYATYDVRVQPKSGEPGLNVLDGGLDVPVQFHASERAVQDFASGGDLSRRYSSASRILLTLSDGDGAPPPAQSLLQQMKSGARQTRDWGQGQSVPILKAVMIRVNAHHSDRRGPRADARRAGSPNDRRARWSHGRSQGRAHGRVDDQWACDRPWNHRGQPAKHVLG